MDLTALFGLVASSCNWLISQRNLREYRRPFSPGESPPAPRLSVCIPMRDEARNLDSCLNALRASDYPDLEILVYDDESSDDTAERLHGWSLRDPRVRVVPTRPLPGGWTGKQHACHQLAAAATGEWLLFTDADVQFEPHCLTRTVEEAERKQLGLLSGFPAQELGSLGEALLIPMIGFVCWSYLPLWLMRERPDLPISAGCGQFLLVSRQAYEKAGGHAQFPRDTHDGLYLPRAVRSAGFRVDFTDLSSLARCRMYRSTREAWRGFSRNAFEALGSLPMLTLFSFWHVLGLAGSWFRLASWPGLLAVALQVHQRWSWSRALRQPRWVIALHPFSLLAMTAVQWWSWVLTVTGQRRWKGRVVIPGKGP